MNRPRRPAARHRSARTAQAALSGAKTLDAAAAYARTSRGRRRSGTPGRRLNTTGDATIHQPKPPLALLAPVITRDDYELWPRGRIIYERTPDRFVVDADRQRLAPPWLAQIITLFHLPPARTTARSDLHYRSTRAIGPP
jgi:hypothetical protein